MMSVIMVVLLLLMAVIFFKFYSALLFLSNGCFGGNFYSGVQPSGFAVVVGQDAAKVPCPVLRHALIRGSF